MPMRRQLAALLAAVYLAGAFLVPVLHTTEPADHGLTRAAQAGCVDCAQGAWQAPCPQRGPCENPNHEHGGHPAGHAVPCPRCAGTFGATLVAGTAVVIADGATAGGCPAPVTVTANGAVLTPHAPRSPPADA